MSYADFINDAIADGWEIGTGPSGRTVLERGNVMLLGSTPGGRVAGIRLDILTPVYLAVPYSPRDARVQERRAPEPARGASCLKVTELPEVAETFLLNAKADGWEHASTVEGLVTLTHTDLSGELLIDLGQHRATINNATLPLTYNREAIAKECQLFASLMQGLSEAEAGATEKLEEYS